MSNPETTAPDPLGHALLAYQQGQLSATLAVHSSVADEEVLPAAYFFRSLWEMPELERTALEQCQGRVLDLGGGAGCHALELQTRGFVVKSVDISPGAVAVMQQRGVREVACHDLFDPALAQGEKFDTLLMLMNGLGLVGTLAGLERFLLHAKSLLNPGGQILATSSDISYMYEDEDGALVFDLNGPYYGEVTYSMQYGTEQGAEFGWIFADPGLLQDCATAAGYEVEFLEEDEHQQYLVRLSVSF